MRYIAISFCLAGIVLTVTERDVMLGVTLLLVAVLMGFKASYQKAGDLNMPHWTDALTERVFICIGLGGFSLSMLAYYYTYVYHGYGLSIEDFDNMRQYCWDIISFNYPNGDNECFLCKSFAILFFVMGCVFVVIDKKNVTKNKCQKTYAEE